MKKREDLERVFDFVKSSYNSFGNRLELDIDKPYDPEHSELGYCYKYVDPVNSSVVYKICCSKLGIERTDFRVLMHEVGHIYLAHMDGSHEEQDSQIKYVLDNYRKELIDAVTVSTGLSAEEVDKLLQRIIDDPYLNHSLHNIAMDMEVNSSVLSDDDIEEMEMDISSVMPKTQERVLKELQASATDENIKKEIQDQLDKMEKEAKIKLILPKRYGFPNGLTYQEYLMMIVQHPDLFIKMLVNIDMGGNGDTSNVTSQQIQQAMNNWFKQKTAGKSAEYKKGYSDAMRDYNQKKNQQGQQNGQQGQQSSQQPGNQGNQPGQSSQSQDGQSGQSGQSNGQGNSQGGQSGNQGQPSNQQGGQNGGQQGQGQGNGQSDDYNQGYQDAMNEIAQGNMPGSGNGLDSLMQRLGMTPDPGQKKGHGDKQNQAGESPWNGMGSRSSSGDQDLGKDHNSDSREKADKLREAGKIVSGGQVGCSKAGGPDSVREVDKELDEVDTAINEVIRNLKSKVYKNTRVRDVMRNYNRGIQRKVILPAYLSKNSVNVNPKLVFLIDISGSMDTRLIDRILNSISRNLRKINRGLTYDIISWSTYLGEHLKDIDPKKGVPRISCGGGTDMASGMVYFKNNYGPEATLIVVSDFEDSLDEWNKVERTMNGYSIYGWNYGSNSYTQEWKRLIQRNFSNYGYNRY